MRSSGQVCVIALIEKLNLQVLRAKMPSKQTKHKISKPPLELREVVGGGMGLLAERADHLETILI